MDNRLIFLYNLRFVKAKLEGVYRKSFFLVFQEKAWNILCLKVALAKGQRGWII